MSDISGYGLSRNWFDWCFENTEKVNPNHSAIYFFAIEHCNRLGWKEKFGMPTQMTMDAVGIKNWRTYSKAFNDLVDWGFFKVIEKSKNQYSATVIAIVKNTKTHTKALSKATQKHLQKQRRSKGNSTVVIDKPINYITKEPNNWGTEKPKIDFTEFEKWSEQILTDIEFKNLMYREQINCSTEKLTEAIKDHLNLLSRYPNMQPSDFKRFRHSVLKHLKEYLSSNKKVYINSQPQFDPVKK